MTALDRLASHWLTVGRVTDTIPLLRRAISVDPYRETFHRNLMSALFTTGDNAASALVYQHLRLFLSKEIHAEPDMETTELFRKQRSDVRLRAQSSEGASKAYHAPPKGKSPPFVPEWTGGGSLPHPLTALIGREQEIRDLTSVLSSQRLVTLTGAGGAGKTRLAIQVADSVRSRFVDGVFFVERGLTASPNFAITAGNALEIVHICRRLDGFPLAIEMAAARLRVLTVAQIVRKLDDCFHLLTGGSRTALPRHQTLQAALDWSYDLLEPDEQTLLQRLGVFVGGATLEEVEALCTDRANLADQALDLVQQLVDKSFVWTEALEGLVRYRLLETTREYALKQLEASGDAAAIRQRHSEIYAELLERAAAEIEGGQVASWLDRLTAENDNIRAALKWLIRLEAEADNVQRSQRLILGGLGQLWGKRVYLRESQYWTERVLVRDLSPTPLRTELEVAAGFTSLRLGEVAAARAHFENAQKAFRSAGNERGVVRTLMAFGKLAEYLGDHATAHDLYAECLSGFQALNDSPGVNAATNNLGNVALLAGNYAVARAYHKASLNMGSKRDFPVGIAWSLDNLAEVYQAEGNYPEAKRLFKESLTIFTEAEQRRGIVDCLQGLGEVACSGAEDVSGARIAARLLGAAEHMRSLSGIVLSPTELPIHTGAILQAQQALGETTFRQEWKLGSEMPLDEIILYAMDS